MLYCFLTLSFSTEEGDSALTSACANWSHLAENGIVPVKSSESRLRQSCLWQCTRLKTSFSLMHSFIYVVITELFYNHLPFSFCSPLCMQIHPQHKSNRSAAIRYFTFMNSADHLFSFVQSSEGNPVQSCEGKALVKSLVQHGQANKPMPQPFFCK